MTPPENEQREPWGPWASLAFTVVILAIALSSFVLTLTVYAVIRVAQDSSVKPDVIANEITGSSGLLSVTTLVFSLIMAGLAIFFGWLRSKGRAMEYCGIQPVDRRTVIFSLLATLILIAVLDGLSVVFHQDIIPDFFRRAFLDSDSSFLILFTVTVCVVGPISEELLFRGFLFRGLAHSRLGGTGAVITTTIIWTVIHIQYDWYQMLQVFAIGLLFGAVRNRTGSTVPTILMHVLSNVVATAETLWSISH